MRYLFGGTQLHPTLTPEQVCDSQYQAMLSTWRQLCLRCRNSPFLILDCCSKNNPLECFGLLFFFFVLFGGYEIVGSLFINTPLGLIIFHIVGVNTPFLLCLDDLDRQKVYFNKFFWKNFRLVIHLSLKRIVWDSSFTWKSMFDFG